MARQARSDRGPGSVPRWGRSPHGRRLRGLISGLTALTLLGAIARGGLGAEPCILHIDPDSGPAAGGTLASVRLADRLVSADVEVRFGDQPARVVSRSGVVLKIEAPPHPPGVVTIRLPVEACEAEADGGRFTFLAPPQLLAVRTLDPAADTGDLVLEGTGSGFGPNARLLVDGTPVPTEIKGPERVEGRIPAALLGTARHMSLRIQDPKSGISDALPLTIANPLPYLASVQTPPLRAGRGRTPIRLFGRDFRPASVVHIGGQPQEARFLSDKEIEAVLPAETLEHPGNLSIRVVTPGPGGGESDALSLTVLPPPPFGGRFVVFMTNRHGGRNHIRLLDRQTGKLDALEEANSPSASDGYPAISADGRFIVFQSDRHGGQSDILLFDRESRVLDRLPEANDPKAFDGFPSVSPDGRFIVFESDRLNRRPKIFVFDRETRLLTELNQANEATADDGVAAISN
jgi:hypothetical protein